MSGENNHLEWVTALAQLFNTAVLAEIDTHSHEAPSKEQLSFISLCTKIGADIITLQRKAREFTNTFADTSAERSSEAVEAAIADLRRDTAARLNSIGQALKPQLAGEKNHPNSANGVASPHTKRLVVNRARKPTATS